MLCFVRGTALLNLYEPRLLCLQNQRALALYNEAQQAMSQDDFNTARQKLKQAHQLDPQVCW